MINEIKLVLNRASLFQLILISLIGLIHLKIYKNHSVFTALLVSGVASSSYTQLIKLGSNNKVFALFGFPIRLLFIAPPCAILVHKLQCNLIALFLGFVLSQVIYFAFVFIYAKKEIRDGR